MTKKLILTILIAVLVIAIIFSIKSNDVVQKESLPIFFKVAPYIGIAVDKDKLHFGAVPRGGRSNKKFFLYNNDTFDKQVSISSEGIAPSWIVISNDKFNLDSYENKTIFITVEIPDDAEYGNYTGNLNLTFRRT